MQRKQRLKIDGKQVIATDIGVDDLERARWNRDMVAQQKYIQGYLEAESWLEHHKATEPLPQELVGWLPGRAIMELDGLASFVREIENKELRDVPPKN